MYDGWTEENNLKVLSHYVCNSKVHVNSTVKNSHNVGGLGLTQCKPHYDPSINQPIFM